MSRAPSSRPFCRRDLLRAAGATLLVPPFLRSAFAAPETLPPRLVLYMQANGTHPASFWPDAGLRAQALAPLLEDARLAPETTVIKGVALDIAPAKRLGNGHDQGFSSLWTGVPQVGTQSDSWAGGPSLDQVAKRAFGAQLAAVAHPTLNCGVVACSITPKNGHRTSFSYVGSRQQIPTEIDPIKLWTALFAARPPGETPAQAEARARARLRGRRSILDAVSADLRALAGRVGPAERRKLELHESGLRELEVRLGAKLAAPAAGARCGPLEGPFAATGSALDPSVEANVGTLAELMLGLVGQALACNVVRIVTFQAGYSGNNWRYGWLDPPFNNDSHQLAHSDGGGDAEVARWMTAITAWHARNVAQLAGLLAETAEGGGSALDNALVVWANENANGGHSLEDLPIVFVGRAGGRLRKTGRLVDVARRASAPDGTSQATHRPHHELGTTVLGLLGLPVHGFGERPGCGPLPAVV